MRCDQPVLPFAAQRYETESSDLSFSESKTHIAAIQEKPFVQSICFWRAFLQCVHERMRQIETRCIYISGSLVLICNMRVKVNQVMRIFIFMRHEQALLQSIGIRRHLDSRNKAPWVRI